MANKNKKPNEIQQASIETIKKYLDKYVAETPDAYSVDYEEKNTKSNIYFRSSVSYKNFKAVIKYDGELFMQENNLDIVFSYEGCPYYFSIYNIFNLFEINDFNCYYYQNCLGSASINDALKNLTSVVEKYYREIRDAGNQTNLPTLIKQFEEDQLAVNGEDWKDEIDDPDSLDLTHIFFLTTTAKNNEKLIKKLEKYDKKGRLVLYEKRLLKYLASGNELPQSTDRSDKCEKEIKKAKAKVYPVVIVPVCLVLAVIEFVVFRLLYADGFVPWDDLIHIGTDSLGFDVPLQVLFFIASAAFMSCFFILVVGKKLVRKICTDDVNDYMETKEKINVGHKKLDKINNKYFAPAAFLFFSLLLFFAANIGISFTDDGIRCHQTPFVVETVSYDDIEIYKIKQLYDDDNGYVDCDGICYAVGWDDNYYILSQCDELGKTDKKIREIASQHGKQIIDIDNDNVLYDMY